MGDTGMGEMFEMSHHMTRPPNFLPFGSPGPFGMIDMSGMFTIVKVREGITNYNDPGWYASSSTEESSSKMQNNQMKMDHEMMKQDEPLGQGAPAEMEQDHTLMKSTMIHPDNMPARHVHDPEKLKIGDLHPMILHFPIVLFLMAFVLDFLFLIGKVKEPYSNAAHWIVIIATVMAVLTVITGLYAKLSHGDNPDVMIHRNWGLITLIYSVGHAIFRGYAIRNKRIFSAWIFVLISLINLGLISIMAEYGGIVTRGKGLWIHSSNYNDFHQK
jgi:uncharacterized membrane protein